MAIGLMTNGAFRWKRANLADQGTKGEGEIVDELIKLANESWHIDYGNRLVKGIGNVDMIDISPSKKTFVIERL